MNAICFKKKFVGLLILSLFLAQESCQESEYYKEKQYGKLMLSLQPASLTITNYSSKSAEDDIDYQVAVYAADDTNAVIRYDSYAEIPDEITLPIGDYYVNACTPHDDLPAFDSPCYGGSSDIFSIYSLSATRVDVECAMTDIMVGVTYSDSLEKTYDSYSTTVSNAFGQLTFGANESRKGYFQSGPLFVNSQLSYSLNGVQKEVELSGMIINPLSGNYYEIAVNSQVPEGGSFLRIITNTDQDTVAVNVDDQTSVDLSDDLLITELMADPKALSDAGGEWLELYNNSDKEMNLNGVFLQKEDGSRSIIDQDVIVKPENYAVLAVSDTATNNVDYVYSKFTLSNSGDLIQMGRIDKSTGKSTIFFYTDFGGSDFPAIKSGYAIQLDPSVHTLAGAQDGSNWCYATLKYETPGDYGTPGEANSSCK